MISQFYFGSNFKMHQTPDETRRFINSLRQMLPHNHPSQLFLIPPFTSLSTAHEALANSAIWLGAQNMHWAEEGAYTGEISPVMLRAIGVDLVMLGHAERRGQFGETDEALRMKINAAVRNNLQILLCVGENAEEWKNQIAVETVRIQLKVALADMDATYLSKLMIAYEPVWSIGEGGSPADPQTVAEMHDVIRDALLAQFSDQARVVPILYGGSVNPTNCKSYAALPQVDGLFVGRAAWSPTGFVEVMRLGYQAASTQLRK